jgi:two-component system phosphate regulon sensor histidine kinase PhoR
MNDRLVERAVANLIDNAIKYSTEGRNVDIKGERSAEYVRISVVDQGCGIDPEHLPRLFERFYRVDKARSRDMGGTGLGLALVKHIAQIHGGHAEVKSTAGAGSIFSISLKINHL